jgi:hypothetical protein
MIMRLITAASGFLAVSLVSSFGGPSLSSAIFAPESRTTDLVGRACQVDPGSGSFGSGDEQLKRCAGLGGARVTVTSDNSSVALGFEWSAKEKAEDVLRNWGLGYKLEWRGYRTARGFEPYAATIRLLFNEGGGTTDRPILAVLRVRRGEACLVALVDMAANPDGYDAARRVADQRAPGFSCGRDQPRVEGTPTSRAAAVLNAS